MIQNMKRLCRTIRIFYAHMKVKTTLKAKTVNYPMVPAKISSDYSKRKMEKILKNFHGIKLSQSHFWYHFNNYGRWLFFFSNISNLSQIFLITKEFFTNSFFKSIFVTHWHFQWVKKIHKKTNNSPLFSFQFIHFSAKHHCISQKKSFFPQMVDEQR